ncbi:coiled-coil domain-containing protein 121 [Echinops telfairi]|uniref:Coiled-coil domain-containing protein 121 n=1 Tax=Echinops telfairi TaxID=9371 RepID=A0ABM0ZSI5_ECHTE|nr:coiled-coil domain-containing protein 121 [Echinops telfairi]
MSRAGLPVFPRGTGSGAARASPAAEEVKPVRTRKVGGEPGHCPHVCWAAPRPAEPETDQQPHALGLGSRVSLALEPSAQDSATTCSELHNHHHLEDERFDPWSTFTEGPGTSLPPYLNLIHTLFNPTELSKTELFKEKAMREVMELNKQIKQIKIQVNQLKEDSSLLWMEKQLVQAEHKLLVECLANKIEESEGQPVRLWNNYVQKSEEIELRRQESAARYAKQASTLKAEFLQKQKTQALLKHQLQALESILTLKEKQDVELETLQKEKRKVQDEGAAKAQEIRVQLLEEKTRLEKQLSEPDLSQVGKRKRWELNKKSQTLALSAKQYTLEFYRSISREKQQLQMDLQQLVQQSQEMVACQRHLKNRRQQLQQEQWYLEGVIRGKQRMQARSNWCLKRQGGLKTSSAPPLDTKSRVNPKESLK